MDQAFQKQVVEALIFASDVPLSDSKISSYVEELTPKVIRDAVKDLNSDYSETKRAFRITKVAGGYQLNTGKEFTPWIKKLFKGRARQRLSQAGLESLAIVAFKQPISRTEIDAIRGVNSGGVLKNLLERNLIAIAGRSSAVGKPLLYGTTSEFLRYFGINDISDLPKPKEIEEIMGKMDGAQEVSGGVMAAIQEIAPNEAPSHDEDETE
ncbi:SMC-Scp complex subunit ScpB [bacterium]|nr:SMC-Scp complex subunit ScpB [bacterium]